MKKKDIILEFFITSIFGFIVGGFAIWKIYCKIMKKDNQKIKKITEYNDILHHWLVLRQNNKTILNFFERNNFKSVAIYGMGELGKRLMDELEGTGIIKYVIDQNNISINKEIPVLSPEDTFPMVDVIVVTPTYYFKDIESKIKNKVNGALLSLEDVIYGEY